MALYKNPYKRKKRTITEHQARLLLEAAEDLYITKALWINPASDEMPEVYAKEAMAILLKKIWDANGEGAPNG